MDKPLELSITRGVLARKLLFSILLFSSFVTIILTTTQLYLDYKTNVKGLKKSLNDIQASHLESLSQNLWHLNDAQIILQLKGILQIPDITYIEILSPNGDRSYNAGEKPLTSNIETRQFPIHITQYAESYYLGQLNVYATLDNIYRTLMNRFFIILATQGAKTFIVSFFILFIFHYFVGQHLITMARFFKNTNIDNLESNLVLNKAQEPKLDEIDQLAIGFNKMRKNLQDDINQRRIIEAQLRQAQKMEALGTLAGGVAHDFNNILQGVMNCFQLMEDDLKDNPSHLSKINIGVTLCERGKDLVKQILLYSRREDSLSKSFSPDSIIRDVVEILNITVNNNIDFQTIIEPNLPKMQGDPTQLRQVILNLCTNSAHALKNNHNSIIRITMEKCTLHSSNNFSLPAGDYCEIHISDNGHGMAEEVKNRIFEPFYTTKQVGEGTGLGLSVVQGIIENHKGVISVDSVEGEGTTFTILLPFDQVQDFI